MNQIPTEFGPNAHTRNLGNVVECSIQLVAALVISSGKFSAANRSLSLGRPILRGGCVNCESSMLGSPEAMLEESSATAHYSMAPTFKEGLDTW
jgi:hypothetical protein